ncbi:MAG: replication initiation protein [Clostridium sp.]
MKNEIVNTPNNIVKGKIEIDAQINKIYYRILNNIQRDNRDLIIKIKKGQELTEEQRIILEKLENMDILKCKLKNEEIYEILQRRNDRTKDEIDKRFNALQSAIFKFSTGEKSSTMSQLIGTVTENEDGYIINLDAKLYIYLFYNLDVGFTPVNLATLFSLQGQYAQSLYVLLRSWTGTKNEIEFTVEELREHFKIGEKYKAYRNFKQRVILQAIDEINNTGSMTIDKDKLVEKKIGRSVNSIIFKVIDHETRFSKGNKDNILETEKVKVEAIEWIPGIMVENINLANVLDALYGDIKHGLAKDVLFRAYLKTLEKDKNGDKLLTRRNRSFFTLIADEELQKYQTEVIGEIVEEAYY